MVWWVGVRSVMVNEVNVVWWVWLVWWVGVRSVVVNEVNVIWWVWFVWWVGLRSAVVNEVSVVWWVLSVRSAVVNVSGLTIVLLSGTYEC